MLYSSIIYNLFKNIMKKAILIAVLMCVALAGKAQSAFFRYCEDMENVETVYISKTMLHLVGLMKVDTENFDLNSLVRKLDSVEIVEAGGTQAVALEKKAATNFHNYEKLMTVKDDSENVDILYKRVDKEHNTFVIMTREPSELVIVILTGTLTPEDVVKATRK